NATLAAISMGTRKVTEIRGKIVKAAKGQLVLFRNISGRFHGGKLVGKASMRLGEKVSYAFRVSVQGAELEKLANAGVTDPNAMVKMPGSVSGDLALQQTLGEADSRRATGTLTISDAKLYRVPVLLGLLQVITLQLPGESAFNEGTIRYQLSGDRLLLREINLSGQGLSIVGSGVMNMDSEKIRLNFLSRTVGKLPGIGRDLETLLKPFTKEIMEIQVTGTLKKPRMRTVALRSLDSAIRRLLSPELEDD
ncbi:MAG: AsmA-like C-terminal domain-containing protein, partial [Phycisphaerae bacterium]